jgi:hypothetical protein
MAWSLVSSMLLHAVLPALPSLLLLLLLLPLSNSSPPMPAAAASLIVKAELSWCQWVLL